MAGSGLDKAHNSLELIVCNVHTKLVYIQYISCNMCMRRVDHFN